MKKFLAAILAVLYLSTSLGATVHLHYCMGRLVGWGLIHREGKECMSCGMPIQQAGDEGGMVTAKSCCQDVHKQIKNEKDQKPGQNSPELTRLAPVALPQAFSTWQETLVHACPIQLPAINGPPLTDAVPVFLRHCNFRI
jgi:hypothetical protein